MAKALKRFIALARVSSREQEREGFSLDVQEDALQKYAERQHGEIIKLFRIAETASKTDARKSFKEMIAYVKKNAVGLDGILFYKVDRAARNLFDYVELEHLESDYEVPFISVSQPTESTPSGRMQRRMLANMASFYTEQQSVDVREGLSRRVQSGLFVGKAPFGYRNFRKDGRGLIEVHPENGPKVHRIFELYAYHNHTLDSLCQKLVDEGVIYLPEMPQFNRSKLHAILRDRAYIGEVFHQDQWYPGSHEPLIDRATWDRTQALSNAKVYSSTEMTYAGELITCGHCGKPITGESKTKKTKTGEKEYLYYRCSKYNAKGHPRIRLPESDLDHQTLALFDQLRIEDEKVRDHFLAVLRAQTQQEQQESKAEVAEIKRQHALIQQQQDRLLNLRLLDEINGDTFASKSTELRDQLAKLRLQLDIADRQKDEYTDIAVKAFELSQVLRPKWLTADYATKRRILEIVCLNFRLVDVSLVAEMRKPFDVLIKGLPVLPSRGDRI
jgi:site-specific DNA recombinase